MSGTDSASAAAAAAAALVDPHESASSSAYTANLHDPFSDEECAIVQKNIKAVEDKVQSTYQERMLTAASAAVPGAGHPVRIVAVGKTKPVRALQAAYAAGQRHFGENYVPELVAKAPLMPADTLWHMIGHLQSNKADELLKKVPSLACVETVDSVKLATVLNKAVGKAGRDKPLDVLIQVNTSGEDTKSGIFPAESPLLVELALHIKKECPLLRLKGLMTIGMPDFTSKPENFVCLQQCRKRVADAVGVAEGELELSMGMSGDFVQAVAMGSTNVRVGSTIFGARVYHHHAPAAAQPAAAVQPQQ